MLLRDLHVGTIVMTVVVLIISQERWTVVLRDSSTHVPLSSMKLSPHDKLVSHELLLRLLSLAINYLQHIV